jgi:tetratricopeptide (TPR) repeat protein
MKVETTPGQKLALIAFGLVITLALLELGLRLAGHVHLERLRSVPLEERAAANETRAYKILALGESTTAWRRRGWPNQLQAILNERSTEYHYYVFNEGSPATNTAFILATLEEKLDRYRPDMVITMMGTNDYNLTYRHDEEGLAEARSFWRQLRIVKVGKWVPEAVRDWIGMEPEETPARPARASRYEPSREYLDLVEKAKAANAAGKPLEAEGLYEEAIRLDPSAYQAFRGIAYVYDRNGRLEKAEWALMRCLELRPNDPLVTTKLGTVFRRLNRKKEYIAEDFESAGLPLRAAQERDPLDATRYHYRRLYETLKERGIRYIAMQYPRLDVQVIRDMLEDAADVTFISNQENFEAALESHSYAEIFADSFAKHRPPPFGGDFGHMTLRGERLIAENLAAVILEVHGSGLPRRGADSRAEE